jgi:hypothetical protein
MNVRIESDVMDKPPTVCPYGHPFGPGRFLVGWLPCRCDWAQALGGHRTYFCNACDALSDRRQTICYFPPHRVVRAPADFA